MTHLRVNMLFFHGSRLSYGSHGFALWDGLNLASGTKKHLDLQKALSPMAWLSQHAKYSAGLQSIPRRLCTDTAHCPGRSGAPGYVDSRSHQKLPQRLRGELGTHCTSWEHALSLLHPRVCLNREVAVHRGRLHLAGSLCRTSRLRHLESMHPIPSCRPALLTAGPLAALERLNFVTGLCEPAPLQPANRSWCSGRGPRAPGQGFCKTMQGPKGIYDFLARFQVRLFINEMELPLEGVHLATSASEAGNSSKSRAQCSQRAAEDV